jgi:predicted permease
MKPSQSKTSTSRLNTELTKPSEAENVNKDEELNSQNIEVEVSGLENNVPENKNSTPLASNSVKPLEVAPETEGFWWTFKKIMNPPIYAALISIPLAFIPGMKDYVFCNSGAVLTNNVFLAWTALGSTVTPLINVLLGSKLSRGYPPDADITW